MYIDIKVYFQLIMETNYDSRFKGKKIVSFPPFLLFIPILPKQYYSVAILSPTPGPHCYGPYGYCCTPKIAPIPTIGRGVSQANQSGLTTTKPMWFAWLPTQDFTHKRQKMRESNRFPYFIALSQLCPSRYIQGRISRGVRGVHGSPWCRTVNGVGL